MCIRWLKQKLMVGWLKEASPCDSVDEVVFLGPAICSPHCTPTGHPCAGGQGDPHQELAVAFKVPAQRLIRGQLEGMEASAWLRRGPLLFLPVPSPCCWSLPSLSQRHRKSNTMGLGFRVAAATAAVARQAPFQVWLRPRCSTHRYYPPSGPPPAQTCAVAVSAGPWGWPPGPP